MYFLILHTVLIGAPPSKQSDALPFSGDDYAPRPGPASPLYIPHDNEGIANAINVIKDQMEQISLALQRMETEGGGI